MARITGVITEVHESEVDMWIVTAKCLGMIGGTSRPMSLVCDRNWSVKCEPPINLSQSVGLICAKAAAQFQNENRRGSQ